MQEDEVVLTQQPQVIFRGKERGDVEETRGHKNNLIQTKVLNPAKVSPGGKRH